jgi:hypothetical protein
MGYGSFDNALYSARSASLHSAGRSSFEYHEDVQAGRVAPSVHAGMVIKGAVRESRDSAQHPMSRAIALGFDVTGSMRNIPRIFQENLGKLMEVMLSCGFVQDPQFLIAAFDDYNCISGNSLQVGQFESDNCVDMDLAKLWLTGQGGGTFEESSELFAYALAHRTAIDCYEKRQQRGYAFIFTDEKCYTTLSRSAYETVFGDPAKPELLPQESQSFSGTTVTPLFTQLRAKYDVFVVIPSGTSHYNDPELTNFWRSLVGEDRVLQLSSPAYVAYGVAACIGVAEGYSKTSVIARIAQNAGLSDGEATHLSTTLSQLVHPLKEGSTTANPVAPKYPFRQVIE